MKKHQASQLIHLGIKVNSATNPLQNARLLSATQEHRQPSTARQYCLQVRTGKEIVVRIGEGLQNLFQFSYWLHLCHHYTQDCTFCNLVLSAEMEFGWCFGARVL